MGSNAYAHLAYGYHLGSGEDFKAAERGEYGEPKLPWLPVDEDGDTDYSDFAEEVERRLLASVGFTEEWAPGINFHEREKVAKEQIGVELTHSGHVDYPGWLLIASASETSVEWAQVMTLDPAEMIRQSNRELWDTKLAAAVTTLGITPVQHSPKWLVFPSYG